MVDASTALLSACVSGDEHALLEATEVDLLEGRVVTIPADEWEKFKAWVNEPGRNIPALRKLSATRPLWQD